MADTGQIENKQMTAHRQKVRNPPAPIDREAWIRRRKRNTMIGLLLGLAAIFGSLGYSLHNAVSRIDTSVGSQLGPTTNDQPSTAMGAFRPVGPPVVPGEKPRVTMLGTLGCDDCAAERWALVKALGRFGTWSSLAEGSSAASIPTFDLTNATYSSWYVALDHRDFQDAAGRPLQTLSGGEEALLARYDPGHTTPLLLVGKYVLVGQGVPPRPLLNRSFRSVQTALITNAHTSYTGSVNAEANLITAMLCHADGGKPGVFCSRPEIGRIEARLGA